MSLRIYLTGRICIESGQMLLEERRLASRQCRLAFAYLVCERDRPVAREDLADVVWPGTIPAAWETAMSALVSRIRRMFGDLSLTDSCFISNASGCYQLHLPDDAWIDLEAGAVAIHEAESALRRGAPKQAWGPANVAAAIARRPFLPSEEGTWVERQRTTLHTLLVRALDCLSDIWLANGESTLAVEAAKEVV